MTFYFYLTKHVSQTHNDTLTIMTFYSHIFITTFFKSCAQGDSKINEKISYLILEKLLLHIDTSATTHSISPRRKEHVAPLVCADIPAQGGNRRGAVKTLESHTL
jgi:hypothetical protein